MTVGGTDTKLCVPLVTLSTIENQEVAKELKDRFIRMSIKQKGRIKRNIQEINIDILFNLILLESID